MEHLNDTELNTYMLNQRSSLKQFDVISEFSDEDRDYDIKR